MNLRYKVDEFQVWNKCTRVGTFSSRAQCEERKEYRRPFEGNIKKLIIRLESEI
jgi:hypothetical protein